MNNRSPQWLSSRDHDEQQRIDSYVVGACLGAIFGVWFVMTVMGK